MRFSRDMRQIVGKCPISQCQICLRKFLDPDPDNFQNLTGSSLCTDTSAIKFSQRSVRLFWLKLLTDWQTNRRDRHIQTNAARYITPLAEVMGKSTDQNWYWCRPSLIGVCNRISPRSEILCNRISPIEVSTFWWHLILFFYVDSYFRSFGW